MIVNMFVLSCAMFADLHMWLMVMQTSAFHLQRTPANQIKSCEECT